MKIVFKHALWAVLFSAGLTPVVSFGAQKEDGELVDKKDDLVVMPRQEAEQILQAVEKVMRSHKAPRDGSDLSDPENPVGGFDTAVLDEIQRCVCLLKKRMGSPNDDGVCFGHIVTQEQLDNATLNIYQWLKTIMYELRGVCPCEEEQLPV